MTVRASVGNGGKSLATAEERSHCCLETVLIPDSRLLAWLKLGEPGLASKISAVIATQQPRNS